VQLSFDQAPLVEGRRRDLIRTDETPLTPSATHSTRATSTPAWK
jgi:hypothetical protein